jgi:hypothetical protein
VGSGQVRAAFRRDRHGRSPRPITSPPFQCEPQRLVIQCRSRVPGPLASEDTADADGQGDLFVALAVCLIGGFMVSAAAQPAGDKTDHIMATPDAVKWLDAPPSLPAGAK